MDELNEDVDFEDEAYYGSWEDDRICSYPCHVCGEDDDDELDLAQG